MKTHQSAGNPPCCLRLHTSQALKPARQPATRPGVLAHPSPPCPPAANPTTPHTHKLLPNAPWGQTRRHHLGTGAICCCRAARCRCPFACRASCHHHAPRCASVCSPCPAVKHSARESRGRRRRRQRSSSQPHPLLCSSSAAAVAAAQRMAAVQRAAGTVRGCIMIVHAPCACSAGRRPHSGAPGPWQSPALQS